MFQDQLSASYVHYLVGPQVQASADDNMVHSTPISKPISKEKNHTIVDLLLSYQNNLKMECFFLPETKLSQL